MIQPQPAQTLLAVGTYTERMPHVDGQGGGVHLLHFDAGQGTFGPDTVIGGLRNPTYLAASDAGDRLYAVCEIDAEQGPTLETYALDPAVPQARHLASTPIGGGWPCHVSVGRAGGFLAISNYQTGNFTIMQLGEDGCPAGTPDLIQRQGSGPVAGQQDTPHGHCALQSPDGRHLYLCDLGTDAIARHPITGGRVSPTPDLTITTSPGAGPRHIVFPPSGQSLLALHELGSTITLHSLDEPERVAAEISTLPGGWAGKNSTAAIRIHPSGRFVYASNRGHDSVFAARLDEAAGRLHPLGNWPAGGRTPRDIAVTPDGAFLLAASQDDHLISVFAIDAATGALQATGHRLELKSPTCLCFIPAAGSPRAA
jgi:6-phosphogluconolactonase